MAPKGLRHQTTFLIAGMFWENLELQTNLDLFGYNIF